VLAGGPGRTRRWLLKAGAAGAVGVFGARTGWLVETASATPGLSEQEIFPGELVLFAGDYVPHGWLGCVGEELAVEHHGELAHALGDTFGGDGRERFRLPDLRGRALVGAGEVSGEPPRKVGEHGRGLVARSVRANIRRSTLALTYLISPEFGAERPLVGEVRAFAFQVVTPRHWLPCDGRELAIHEHPLLHSVIGARFGRTSPDTFSLPDLHSTTPLSHGENPKLPPAPFATRRHNLALDGAGRRPRLHVNYCIAVDGRYPTRQ
jgi:microcystin-dependent protein